MMGDAVRYELLCGDAAAMLATLPAESVQTVVTSPPYYSLRDYNVDGQIGLEETPAAYIERLVAVFAEVKRVLRSDGTLWVNMGSSYASGTIESEEYILRDDISDEERAYVYRELAAHFTRQSEAMPTMRPTYAPAEQDVSGVLPGIEGTTRELRHEGM